MRVNFHLYERPVAGGGAPSQVIATTFLVLWLDCGLP